MLTVNLLHHSYPIYIGHAIFSSSAGWKTLIDGTQVCLVTNETLASLHLTAFSQHFSQYTCSTVILPDGENYKNLEHWVKILEVLVNDQHRRNTTLIALGGGVIGDITGFAAACYQRGVNFIQVPTTLLAQVDAALGGKTAVNCFGLKNLVGTFYQPKAVIIDTSFLLTLPEREFRAGLAEVIKYALIKDKKFFDYLCAQVDAILKRDIATLTYVIEICCRIKIHYIERDEFDVSGIRALLNFGHTFGHALESVSEYTVLHGEAVAWGMLQACRLSQHLGYLSSCVVSQVKQLLQRCELLIPLPENITASALIKTMYQDKKNQNEGISFILLKALGEAFRVSLTSSEVLFQLLEEQS